MNNPSQFPVDAKSKRPWTRPELVVIARAQDAEQNFGFCADGQAGRGRRVLNCS